MSSSARTALIFREFTTIMDVTVDIETVPIVDSSAVTISSNMAITTPTISSMSTMASGIGLF